MQIRKTNVARITRWDPRILGGAIGLLFFIIINFLFGSDGETYYLNDDDSGLESKTTAEKVATTNNIRNNNGKKTENRIFGDTKSNLSSKELKRKGYFDIRSSAVICTVTTEGIKPYNYIDEFITYHLGIGFEHIFLYDVSGGNTLRKWFRPKQVSIIPIDKPGKFNLQMVSNSCISMLQNYPGVALDSWVTFLDIEDYVVLKKHSNVMEFLNSFETTESAVALNMFDLDWNDQVTYVEKPLSSRFNRRKMEAEADVKIISRIPHLKTAGVKPNSFVFKDPKSQCPTDTSHKVKLCRGETTNPNGPVDVASIYRYTTKSVQEFKSRCAFWSKLIPNSAYCQPESAIQSSFEYNSKHFRQMHDNHIENVINILEIDN